MLGIVAALVTFGVLIAVRYRDGLEQRLHTDLTSGASALNAAARTPGAFTFLADASHELRTPAAALHSTAERLLRDQPERPQRDAIEAQPARDSGRLGRLIHDLLNLARLDARERPHREPVDLADLASAAVAPTRTNDPDARVELIAAGPVPATGEREALLRAVRNLLDNAFAVAVAGTVVVEVTQTANGLAISVTDNGPGVPPDQRERIFEPFVRLPRSRRRGTGLGLAIVRRTIESHGGTITCDPSATGGARFTLRLPADS